MSKVSTDSVRIVGAIIIGGNDHTKEFVILREMSLQPGMVITQQLLEYDQNRIYSLGLFNRVQITPISAESARADLHIEVSERWYLFPYPIFGLKDRDWGKAFYGAGVVHNNFRGRNEKLFGSFALGYDPSFSAAYRNSFLDAAGMYSIDGRITYNRVRNKSLQARQTTGDFEEHHYMVALSIGRRIGIAHLFWFGGAFEEVRVGEYAPNRTLSLDGIDRYPSVTFGFMYDTRDLREYPSHGSYRRFSATKLGIPGDLLDLVRYAGDLRQFLEVTTGLGVAGRVFTDLVAGGRTPLYNRVYFGYNERIRGHFSEVMEGENILGASAEFHLTLLEPRYGVIGFLPREFSVWRFGVNAAIFADAGTVWFRDEPLALDDVAKGYGVGLHILLPYSFVVRVEYGWNEARRGEFIFDVGSSF